MVDGDKTLGSISLNLDWILERDHFDETKWVHMYDDTANDEISDGCAHAFNRPLADSSENEDEVQYKKM